MTYLRGPEAFYTLAWLVLNQVQADLGANAVQRVGVYPGRIAWDECECGMLAASVGEIYGSDTFPQPSGQSACASGSLATSITFTLVRCAPQPPENGVAPSITELNEAAALAISDKWYLFHSVGCTLTDLVNGTYAGSPGTRIWDALVGRAVNVGPEGDCVGSEITVQVQIQTGTDA